MTNGHWTATIEPLLAALRPTSVGAVDLEPELRAWLASGARELGYELVDARAMRAEAIVARDGAEVEYARGSMLTVVLGGSGWSDPRCAGWVSRRIEGFGGATVAINVDALDQRPALSAAWKAVGGREHLETVCTELERERARLERALGALDDRHTQLLGELEAALDLLEAAEVDSSAEFEAVEAARVQVRALARRKRMLEHRVAGANAVAQSAQNQLAAERRWVADKAIAVASSQSWRLGHRLVRTMRLLTFRRDRGADGLTVILRRMEDGSRHPPRA